MKKRLELRKRKKKRGLDKKLKLLNLRDKKTRG